MEIKQNEPMSRHTTYKIGGPAREYAVVESETELAELLMRLKADGENYAVVGKGSNLLVSDRGYDGCVIKLGGVFNSAILNDDDTVTVGAGHSTSRLGRVCLEAGYGNLAFMIGLPGTIGGALRMNAGCWSNDIGRNVATVKTMDGNGDIKTYEDIVWKYRSSSIPEYEIILSTVLKLSVTDEAETIMRNVKEHLEWRQRNQPLDKPSCGSVFRNTEGKSSGYLIEEAGLKGKRVGGAQISPVHANFIVNDDNATASDIKTLIRECQKTVKEKYGHDLIPEVRFLE